MVALAPIQNLKRKKELLLKQQKALIQLLKDKHADVYDWMQEHKIDPTDLKIYSTSLALAVVVGFSSVNTIVTETRLVPHVNIIEVSELTGLKDDARASLVWSRYGHIIERSANKYNLKPELIFATVMLESSGNTYAVRQEPSIGDASYGLGQILYGTARGMGYEGNPEGLFDPEVNIELIARYHSRNQEVYGPGLTDEQLTAIYNSGNPYSSPIPGHINKFKLWYNRVAQYTG